MKKWNHKTKKYENFKSPAKNMGKTDCQIKLSNKLPKSISKDLDKKHIAYLAFGIKERTLYRWVSIYKNSKKKS